ncbi:3' terminal RNA ribose 2'-O-methyltransferase Hen1 [Bacillus salipaludis]|uniref:Small RNA 2'-O-methyltransferase n=1 Tax=Bacillus salipaludis TaxID=2547811 RepID=A0A4V3AT46_9BACI|nr:3' terminal RNA ribose 2'-O-methyltransferase Hen1 [Bacillus salipaludis]MDQ6598977.1 3' terminal RNA ribose 2'-O-methyltransferase Hen1 [Bacillus salipaludis]TDK58324.1 3' terminal RNA ribose 2'-O-methyltransferase Hen1 [Bacillus salipaludis]
MQLSFTIRGQGAEAVSYLLAKNPNNLYERDEKGFKTRIVYTTFTPDEIQFLIYVKPDAIDLVRNSADIYDITSYINDREFAVSSIFTSAIRKALGTALNGKPQEGYSKWVQHPFEMEIAFGPVASDLNDEEIHALFEPIGYQVNLERGVANKKIHDKSSAKFITLKGQQSLQNALKHVFLLIPVLDNYKHYFIDEKEIEKLERYGEGWLESHPLKQLIVKRTLRFENLISQSKFFEMEPPKPELPKVRLNDLRYQAIIDSIKGFPNKETIIDLGSGEGKLSTLLGFVEGVKEILAVEPSNKARLRALDRFHQAKEQGIFLEPTTMAGSLFYFDERLQNKDIMILCEVIEHIDEARLGRIFRMIFQDYRPQVLIVTTPNQEYNVVYEMDEEMRHNDHRFEWTRNEFQQKCAEWIAGCSYRVQFQGIGEEHPTFGQPTQMAIFTRKEG